MKYNFKITPKDQFFLDEILTSVRNLDTCDALDMVLCEVHKTICDKAHEEALKQDDRPCCVCRYRYGTLCRYIESHLERCYNK